MQPGIKGKDEFMKIFNLHGYKGASQNAAYKAFMESGCDVFSPETDYDSAAPDKIFERIESLFDYISLGVIKSVICATIAFIVVFALYILYDFEEFMANIYKTDLVQFGKKILIIYFVFVVAYSIISYLVYTYRYTKARKSLKRYYNNLKKLAFLYEKENKK